MELAGLGPAPFCGMVLGDLGAEVIRVDRADLVTGRADIATESDFTNRGKASIGVNLKHPEGAAIVLDLVQSSDALIEGFRPGVAERLGIGPAVCLARNSSLVYGRMTGWGQEGPLAPRAGHDIDYVALSGSLHAIGTESSPVPPLNLVGDYGGGGMLLALGVLAGIISARETGKGQVVDAAMVDGAALLNTATYGMLHGGMWADSRQTNLLDGGAPFYAVYETADGRHVAVGALEPQFFAELLERLELEASDLPPQSDRAGWPALRRVFEAEFKKRSRDEWAAHFAESDACVTPVLSMVEAAGHPHNRARGTFSTTGPLQPRSAPRFSGTEPTDPSPPSYPGRDTDSILASLGLSPYRIGKLRDMGVVA